MDELKKQLIDQPLHILMGIASVCLIAWITSNVWIGVGITVAWESYREYKQWPSSRWWDPPLDWLFEIIGIICGYLIFTNYLVGG